MKSLQTTTGVSVNDAPLSLDNIEEVDPAQYADSWDNEVDPTEYQPKQQVHKPTPAIEEVDPTEYAKKSDAKELTDKEAAEYEHPELVKFLAPDVRVAGDILNSIWKDVKKESVDFANESANFVRNESMVDKEAYNDTLKALPEGPVKGSMEVIGEVAYQGTAATKAVAKVVARASQKAAAGALTFPVDAANLTSKLIVNSGEALGVDQETIDYWKLKEKQSEQVGDAMRASLEKAYTEYAKPFHAANPKDQEILDTLGTATSIVAATANIVTKPKQATDAAVRIEKLVAEYNPKHVVDVTKFSYKAKESAKLGAKVAAAESLVTSKDNNMGTLIGDENDPSGARFGGAVTSGVFAGAGDVLLEAMKVVDNLAEGPIGLTKRLLVDETGSVPMVFGKGPKEVGEEITDTVVSKAAAAADDGAPINGKMFEDTLNQEHLRKDYSKTPFKLNKDVMEETAKGYMPLAGKGPIPEETIWTKDPEAQARLAQYYSGKIRNMEGMTLPTYKATVVNTASPFEDMQRAATGADARFMIGFNSTIQNVMNGGVETAFEGATVGFNESKLFGIINDYGNVVEVPDVKNLKIIYKDAADGVAATNPTGDYGHSIQQVKKFARALDVIDDYTNVAFKIQQNVEEIAKLSGIDNLYAVGDGLPSPARARLLGVLDAYNVGGYKANINGTLQQFNLKNPEHLKWLKNGFTNTGIDVDSNATIKKLVDEIGEYAHAERPVLDETKYTSAKQEALDTVRVFKDEPWAQQFIEDKQAFNRVLLEQEVSAGNLSVKTANDYYKAHPNYLPAFKQKEELNFGGSLYSEGTGLDASLKARKITKNDELDVFDSLLMYTRQRATAVASNRVKNLSLRQMLTVLDDSNFEQVFAQPKKKVLEAYNSLLADEGPARTISFRELTGREGMAVTEQEITRVKVNGHTLELVIKDGDIWASLQGWRYLNPEQAGVGLSVYKWSNDIIKHAKVTNNPVAALGIQVKELMDTQHFTQLTPGDWAKTQMERLLVGSAEFVYDVGQGLRGKGNRLTQATREYTMNAGNWGVASSLEAATPILTKGEIFENLLKGTYHGNWRGFKSTPNVAMGLIGNVQASLDSWVRSPEFKSLVERAGLNYEDAIYLASTGSTSFRQAGNRANRAGLKKFQESIAVAKNKMETQLRDATTKEEIKAIKEQYKAITGLKNAVRLRWAYLKVHPGFTETLRATAFSRAAVGSWDVISKMASYEKKKTAKSLAYTVAALSTLELGSTYDWDVSEWLKEKNNPSWYTPLTYKIGDIPVPAGFLGVAGKAPFDVFVKMVAGTMSALKDHLPDTLRTELTKTYPDLVKELDASAKSSWAADAVNAMFAVYSQVGVPNTGAPNQLAYFMGGNNDPSGMGNAALPEYIANDPRWHKHIGADNSPQIIAMAKALYDTTGGRVDISPDFVQNSYDIIRGWFTGVATTTLEAGLGMFGYGPESTAERFNPYNPLTRFKDKEWYRKGQQANARAYSGLRNAIVEYETVLAAYDGEKDEAGKAQYISDNTRLHTISQVMAPFRDKIRDQYKIINDIKMDKLPETFTPIEERKITGSEKKKQLIEQARANIIDIQFDAMQAVNGIDEEMPEVIQYAVMKKEHPWLYGAATWTKSMINSAASNLDFVFDSDEKKVFSIEEDEIQDFPFPEMKPKVNPKDIDTISKQHSTNVREVLDAIDDASATTNFSKSILTMVAARESNLGNNTDPKNPNVTVSGPFQFTDKTWNDGMKLFGEMYNIEGMPKDNPYAQAVMTAAILKDDVEAAEDILETKLTPTEIYSLHLLGRADGIELMKAVRNGDAFSPAKDIFPKEVITNNPKYFGDGSRTVKEVYNAIKDYVVTPKEVEGQQY